MLADDDDNDDDDDDGDGDDDDDGGDGDDDDDAGAEDQLDSHLHHRAAVGSLDDSLQNCLSLAPKQVIIINIIFIIIIIYK